MAKSILHNVNPYIMQDIKDYCPRIYNKIVDILEYRGLELEFILDNGESVAYDIERHRIRQLPKDRDNLSDDELKTEFSIMLRYLMGINRINQTMMSEITGISQPTISNLIHGVTLPNYSQLKRIARALNCSLSDLDF